MLKKVWLTSYYAIIPVDEAKRRASLYCIPQAFYSSVNSEGSKRLAMMDSNIMDGNEDRRVEDGAAESCLFLWTGQR